MALVTCGECGREVSDKAAACPSCGAPISPPAATKKKSQNVGCLPTIIVLVALFWIIGKCAGPIDSGTSSAPVVSDAACAKDLQCWGDKHSSRASVVCQRAVEAEAKYQAEWTDSWAEVKFPRFGWADQSKGTLNYLGDKVKFQNGFGAWQVMLYSCTYDPASQRALAVIVTPRN